MSLSIFVSSTFLDLERHRVLVREAIAKLQQGSTAMEFFGALPESPREECLRLVRSANVYVGIFGMRYGSVDVASGKSLTHLEYEEAQALRLPSLIYLLDEATHLVLPLHVEVGPNAEKLSALKATLRENHVVNRFSSPEDLTAKLTQDIVRLVGAQSQRPTAQVLSQIATNAVGRHPLTPPRFEYLKQQTSEFFKHAVPESVLREALELTIAGDNMAAAFVLSRGTPMPLDNAVDGLMEVDKFLGALVQRHSTPKGDRGDV